MNRESDFMKIELDDHDMEEVYGGTTPSSVPCGGLIISTISACFNKTVPGSCDLGTRGCCK